MIALANARWLQAVAVRSLTFVEKLTTENGIETLHRSIEQTDATYILEETGEAYSADANSKIKR
jgi:hypothetical protein